MFHDLTKKGIHGGERLSLNKHYLLQNDLNDLSQKTFALTSFVPRDPQAV